MGDRHCQQKNNVEIFRAFGATKRRKSAQARMRLGPEEFFIDLIDVFFRHPRIYTDRLLESIDWQITLTVLL